MTDNQQQPLNRVLYDRLVRVFGRVKISSAGYRMLSVVRTNPLTGEAREEIETPGEEYQVCCDRCNDTRSRLYIGHMFGKKSPHTGFGYYHLVHCFNEDCYRDHEVRRSLYDMLCETGTPLASADVRPGKTGNSCEEMQLPGDVVTLDKLPLHHPACAYLSSRHYDPHLLGRFYHVGYCEHSHYSLARDRIIAPIYRGNKLYGWQARHIGELNWADKNNPPKWFSAPGMAKSQLLYNYDNAVKFKVGVMVEGPGDVWAVGPMAVCSFGSTMSTTQRRMFVSGFAKYSGVLLYDPDIRHDSRKYETYKEAVAELKTQFNGQLVDVCLPEGTDPGSLDRAFIRQYVNAEAAKQKVKISWERRQGAS